MRVRRLVLRVREEGCAEGQETRVYCRKGVSQMEPVAHLKRQTPAINYTLPFAHGTRHSLWRTMDGARPCRAR